MMTNHEVALNAAALRFPVGRAVRYYPPRPHADLATKVRSAPWMTGAGVVRVAIDAEPGGVPVSRLEVI